MDVKNERHREVSNRVEFSAERVLLTRFELPTKEEKLQGRRGREGMIFSIKSLRGFCRGGTMDKTEIKENEWTGVSFAGKR